MPEQCAGKKYKMQQYSVLEWVIPVKPDQKDSSKTQALAPFNKLIDCGNFLSASKTHYINSKQVRNIALTMLGKLVPIDFICHHIMVSRNKTQR